MVLHNPSASLPPIHPTHFVLHTSAALDWNLSASHFVSQTYHQPIHPVSFPFAHGETPSACLRGTPPSSPAGLLFDICPLPPVNLQSLSLLGSVSSLCRQYTSEFCPVFSRVSLAGTRSPALPVLESKRPLCLLTSLPHLRFIPRPSVIWLLATDVEMEAPKS